MASFTEQEKVALTERLMRYLQRTGCRETPEFVASGASGAVYRVSRNGELRAIKVCKPSLLLGRNGEAERRRLAVQRRLVSHGCRSLVQIHSVQEFEGAAFIEMELVEWPQLKEVLQSVPDHAPIPLIQQLVAAVRFLEKQGIVHRDIKPENIHVSTDFSQLKLLDLGVARDMSLDRDEDASATDHGYRRPFVATAQYSSPEYLFRLDEPTEKLWRGLNVYQVGAVLHDLIMKRPLFHKEVSTDNRWLVARAVMSTVPSFAEVTPGRLLAAKAVALHCLVKDIDTRLQLVCWEDFGFAGPQNAQTSLKNRLERGATRGGDRADGQASSRTMFQRNEFEGLVVENVRRELVDTCGVAMPLTVVQTAAGGPPNRVFALHHRSQLEIRCHVQFEWPGDNTSETVYIGIGVQLIAGDSHEATRKPKVDRVTAASPPAVEQCVLETIVSKLSTLISEAVDRIELSGSPRELHGVDLIDAEWRKAR